MKEIAATSKAQGYAGDNKSHDKPQGKPPDDYASSYDQNY
jgi:hypothetical protein